MISPTFGTFTGAPLKTRTHLVSIDPGIRAMGGGWFVNGVLAACTLARSPVGDGSLADHFNVVANFKEWRGRVAASQCRWGDSLTDMSVSLAIEIPRVYPASHQKGDQNDLIALAVVAGAVASNFVPGEVTRYYPQEWKGQLDKKECGRRVLERLSPEELEAIDAAKCPAALKHNLLDAIGIGLKKLGRFEPRKVYPL